jgi:LPXTG-site transpeptidase (sortase) family protein
MLKKKIHLYNIKFNTLPPDYRLVIPKLWLDVHVVTLTNIPIEKIKKADYDEYLYDGVVKYPYTPDPDKKWNVFIFGHTSYYWWKKNPYWTVFSSIPKLRHWDIMQLNWNWKTYKYKIFKKLILYPNQVDDVYRKYKNWNYLTIMWCYPIWSDRQRMVIIAKKENS